MFFTTESTVVLLFPFPYVPAVGRFYCIINILLNISNYLNAFFLSSETYTYFSSFTSRATCNLKFYRIIFLTSFYILSLNIFFHNIFLNVISGRDNRCI